MSLIVPVLKPTHSSVGNFRRCLLDISLRQGKGDKLAERRREVARNMKSCRLLRPTRLLPSRLIAHQHSHFHYALDFTLLRSTCVECLNKPSSVLRSQRYHCLVYASRVKDINVASSRQDSGSSRRWHGRSLDNREGGQPTRRNGEQADEGNDYCGGRYGPGCIFNVDSVSPPE
jgi:hypothetical protein